MDRAEFEQYLCEHPDQVYERCSSMRCPIAQFLASKYIWADVGDTTAWVKPTEDTPAYEMVLPEWAQQFIAKFDDESAPRYDGTANGTDALAVLATI